MRGAHKVNINIHLLGKRGVGGGAIWLTMAREKANAKQIENATKTWDAVYALLAAPLHWEKM